MAAILGLRYLIPELLNSFSLVYVYFLYDHLHPTLSKWNTQVNMISCDLALIKFKTFAVHKCCRNAQKGSFCG